MRNFSFDTCGRFFILRSYLISLVVNNSDKIKGPMEFVKEAKDFHYVCYAKQKVNYVLMNTCPILACHLYSLSFIVVSLYLLILVGVTLAMMEILESQEEGVLKP